MRTETTDLRQQVTSLQNLYKEQGAQIASIERKAREDADARIAEVKAAAAATAKQSQGGNTGEGLTVLRDLLEEYKREATKQKEQVRQLEKQLITQAQDHVQLSLKEQLLVQKS